MFAPFLNKKNKFYSLDISVIGFNRNSLNPSENERIIFKGETNGNIRMPENDEKDAYN